MTDWIKVNGSQVERPSEIDEESSTTIVYQRRNITQTEVEDVNGQKVKLWEYEERKMTVNEYVQLQLKQARADVDYLSAMTGEDL